ncbi:ABC transporter substrate-binding protein [Candidatus Zixiibacteriota bacterium]
MKPYLRQGTTLLQTIAVLLLLTLFLAACQGGSDERESAAKGRSTLPRIAALAPSAAEILHHLDALDTVVAIGDFVQWPPELRGLPSIGAYNAPNIEQIMNLEVDLLATAWSEAGSAIHERIRKLGVDVLALRLDTFDGTLESIVSLGEVTGREIQAMDLVSAIRERMEEVHSRVEGLQPRRVMVVVGTDPLYVAGPGSHLEAMVVAAGGVNIFSDILGSYQMVSLESAIERRPEVIIDVSDNRPDALRGVDSAGWARWAFLPAVREGRVYHVDPVRLTIPGPRLPEMTELMAKMIHPEVFGEVTIYELGSLERHVP